LNKTICYVNNPFLFTSQGPDYPFYYHAGFQHDNKASSSYLSIFSMIITTAPLNQVHTAWY